MTTRTTLSIRLPIDLHTTASEKAELANISLNQYIIDALERHIASYTVQLAVQEVDGDFCYVISIPPDAWPSVSDYVEGD